MPKHQGGVNPGSADKFPPQLPSTVIKKTWIAERADFRRQDEPGNGLLDTSFRRKPESGSEIWRCIARAEWLLPAKLPVHARGGSMFCRLETFPPAIGRLLACLLACFL